MSAAIGKDCEMLVEQTRIIDHQVTKDTKEYSPLCLGVLVVDPHRERRALKTVDA